MLFSDSLENREFVYGSKPYAFYEMAILKLNPAISKNEYSKNRETLFAKYSSLTAKEFSELSGTPRVESEKLLYELSVKGRLEKQTTKNGAIWKMKNTHH